MGSIRDLKNPEYNIHLFLSSSGKAEMFVYKRLKEKCNANSDSIFEVKTKNEVQNMFELLGVQSFISDKWLFQLEWSKVKRSIAGKAQVFGEDNAEFLVIVNNYKEYLEAKDYFAPVRGSLNDIYLSFISYYDVHYLLDGFEISDKMISFVYKSYSSDPEQVFVLRNELEEAKAKITTRKQITDLCGVSTGTLNHYALSLLGEEPKGDRGKKMVIRNRVKSAVELSEVYGYSKLRNFLTASVKDILDIKVLYLQGVIYDRISDIPEKWVYDSKGEKHLVYDEKRLQRYNRYLDTIKDIPYERIVRLYLMLKKWGRWYNDSDMINFLYQYYEKGDLI